jgi:Ulp1 protease family, C-terminal catalytic domain
LVEEDTAKNKTLGFFEESVPDDEESLIKTKKHKTEAVNDEEDQSVVEVLPEVTIPQGRNLRSRNKNVKSYAEPSGKEICETDEIPEHVLTESRALAKKTSKTRMPSHPEFDRFNDLDELLTYPPNSLTVVKMEDYKCLHYTELVSDIIIDFQIQYVLREKMDDKLRNQIHVYDSQFYNYYATSSNFEAWNMEENKGLSAVQKRYQRILSFFPAYGNVNIFEKDFIVFPCNDNEHWFLAIVCFPKLNKSLLDESTGDKPVRTSCILVFDSVKANPSRRCKAVTHIRNFIGSEYDAKHQKDFVFIRSELNGYHIRVSFYTYFNYR